MKTIALAALIAALAAPVSAHAGPTAPARLTLTFETGAETGAVMVSLFDSEAAYAGGAPVRQARVDVARGERTAVFAGLPAGTYAFKAFHDVDGDGRMNANPFGLPLEPYAFSNNARGDMGPAGWDRARVAVEGDTAQTIVIR
jgi:uncharacterized protein (DUF2141 family)